MILKRLYNDNLAHASYLIGCPECGEAIVIDPNRDIELYVEAAAKEKLKISAVTETHIHADYLSGSRELAQRTGAKLYLSGEGPKDWQYAFEGDRIKEGDSITIGRIRFDVLHTPGHTPEHISFLITDEAASPEPQALFSGDFLFVGDVGRPDLLEVAAGEENSAIPAAEDLFRSLQRIKGLPEHILVWPAHGAGSACGKSLGGVPVSSIGYEKQTNWALRHENEAAFVDEVLTGQPEPPKYFAEMKRENRDGPAILGGQRNPPRQTHASGALIIDVRDSDSYIAAHLPNVLHVPLGGSFIKWSGSLVPYRTDLLLIAETEERAQLATWQLGLIGLDQVIGWCGPDVLDSKAAASHEQIFARDIPSRPEAQIVDVRGKDEWEEGHIPGSVNIPLSQLDSRASELPKDKPLLVHCGGGTRSSIALSILENKGFSQLVNVEDGYAGYEASREA